MNRAIFSRCRLKVALWAALCVASLMPSLSAHASSLHPIMAVAAGKLLGGTVTDSITGEPLEYVNIYVNDTDGGTITDSKGRFSFRPSRSTDSLRVSCMGYATKDIKVSQNNANRLKIRLVPTDYQLSEVVVKPKKEKYSKKNNPAVEFLNRLKAAADYGNPANQPFYSFDRQDKMVLGLSDFSRKQPKEDGSKGKFDFVNDYIDSVRGKDTEVLKMSVIEQRSVELYSGSPSTHKEIIKGVRSSGLDEAVPRANVVAFLNDLLRNVNIYDDNITLIQNKFVSPLSPIAADYYKFYLDTVMYRGDRSYRLTFIPRTPESMSFQGRLYIPVADSTMTIRHLEMRVPKGINLNFVRDLYIEQDFALDSLGNRNKTHEFLGANFHIVSGTQAIYAEKESSYGNFSYDKREEEKAYYRLPGEFHEDFNSDRRPAEYWDSDRRIALTDVESRMDNLTKQMRGNVFYKILERVVKWVADGYICTSKEDSKFDIGNIISFIAYNKAEGLRLKVGGMTTADLSRHWFARGYVAYGFGDKVWKYNGEVEYSFNPKKRHSREFPINAIRLEHQYDLFQMGQQFNDGGTNLLLSVTRKSNYKVTYRRFTKLTWLKEWTNNLSLELTLQHEIQKSTKFLPFLLSDGTDLHRYSQAYASVMLRYSPGEKFVQGATNRTHVNLDAPIIWIKHEYGPKGFLGSRYNLNITTLSLRYRFWFSSFGYADVTVTGGKCWDSVDFPSLPWPAANLSYTIQERAYSLMNPLEFAVDQYAAWDLQYCGNGILFNRIPLIKKLRLREIIGFKGFFGYLSKKNNPAYNKELFPFPADAETHLLDPGTPYMEMSFGIDNILRLFRVDYVYRLTYRGLPGADGWGIRFGLHFAF